MRNAFVVLVSLCIGLIFGFIAPSSVPEHKRQTSRSTIEKIRGLEKKSTTFASRLLILPESRNNIDEKDLYEHATVKQNNQSERAFIFLNQKYKKPVRTKTIKLSSQERSELAFNLITPSTTATSMSHFPCPNCLESGYSNTYFQGLDIPDTQIHETKSYFVPSSELGCDFKEKANTYKDNKKVKSTNRVDERRDYFELLKPPILRPVNKGTSKANYNVITKNEHSSFLSSRKPYKDSYLKKYSLQNQYSPKAHSPEIVGERPHAARENYGLEYPYIKHYPVFRNKELTHRVDDNNLEGDFVNDDSIFESNQEEDKTLDKYLKDTLEEEIVSHDKGNTNHIDCSYHDCILQISKKYPKNGFVIKPDCKCGRRLNIKQANPFIVKDRSLREEAKRNDTLLKSSEVNDYEEEILTDDSKNNKIDDVIRPPSKFNKTLL